MVGDPEAIRHLLLLPPRFQASYHVACVVWCVALRTMVHLVDPGPADSEVTAARFLFGDWTSA
jgi:hypothetical protein